MDKSITERDGKSIVQEELRQGLLMTKLLEDAGIRVIGASFHNGALSPYILFSGDFDKFKAWTKRIGLNVKATRRLTEKIYPWIIWTEYRGVVIHAFLSNAEKERYFDGAEET